MKLKYFNIPKFKLPNNISFSDNQTYIVPSKEGFIYLFTVVCMILIGLVYSNNLMLVFSFIFLTTFLLCMFITNYNLNAIECEALDCKANHAGQSIVIRLILNNFSSQSKACINWKIPLIINEEDLKLHGEVPVIKENQTIIHQSLIPTKNRYYEKPLKIIFWTTFPLGFFRSWMTMSIPRINPNFEIIVYPKLNGENHLPASIPKGENNGKRITKIGVDDFNDHKRYNSSDGLNQIDWKVYARNRNLLVKTYTTPQTDFLSFKINRQSDIEQQIEQVALWSNLANEKKIFWEIKDQKEIIKLGTGKEHLKRTYKALAKLS